MCGYDPFYWYELKLDQDYEAYQAGYESWEDYQKALQENHDNWEIKDYIESK